MALIQIHPSCYTRAHYAFNNLKSRASCDSLKISYFATVFIDRLAKVSVVISCTKFASVNSLSEETNQMQRIARDSMRIILIKQKCFKKFVKDFNGSQNVHPDNPSCEEHPSGVDMR
jgi:hypothetical protein